MKGADLLFGFAEVSLYVKAIFHGTPHKPMTNGPKPKQLNFELARTSVLLSALVIWKYFFFCIFLFLQRQNSHTIKYTDLKFSVRYFDKCIHPCNHYSKQDIEYPHHPKKSPLPLSSHFHVHGHSGTISVVNSSISRDQFCPSWNFTCRELYSIYSFASGQTYQYQGQHTRRD